MPDLLLELFSEEIPARMQARAADDLKKLVTDALVERGLAYEGAKAFATPRRLTLVVGGLPARQPDRHEERKGPRVGAPEKALEGFLKAAGLVSIDEAVVQADPKGDFYVARIHKHGAATTDVIAQIVPEIVRAFPWPKSMRWGSGTLRWVRPLHAIVATFAAPQEEPEVVRFAIDGVASGDVTRGHRVHAPGEIKVKRFDDYVASLEKAYVIVDPERRRDIIRADARTLAQAQNLELVEDEGLVEEVAGLVEWPVVLMGQFEPEFLEVPDEVIRATIRANQKCFVLRDPATALLPSPGGIGRSLKAEAEPSFTSPRRGEVDRRSRAGEGDQGFPDSAQAPSPGACRADLSPSGRGEDLRPSASATVSPQAGGDGRLTNRFIMVANLEARDGGAAIVHGNEKVVRARLSDARFFWETDKKTTLESRLEKLKSITFHEKLGTQYERVERIARLAKELAPLVGADPDKAERAARLAKADLVTEMVGEFPELQGLMGRYYAAAEGLDPEIAAAIEEHYKPQGPSDRVPTAPVSIAVALADKIDTLVGFWAIDEKPTGSKDPYALRRAALGVVRIVLDNGLRLRLEDIMLSQGERFLDASIHNLALKYKKTFQKHFAFHVFDLAVWDGERNVATETVEIVEEFPGGPSFSYEPKFDDKNIDRLFLVSPGVGQILDNEIDSCRAIKFPDLYVRETLAFFFDRLKVQLREQGVRHDLVDAVFGAQGEAPSPLPGGERSTGEAGRVRGPEPSPDTEKLPHPALRADLSPQGRGEGPRSSSANDDLVLVVRRVEALTDLLATDDGKNLLAGYRRAANILKAEEKKDGAGAFDSEPETALLAEKAEIDLSAALDVAEPAATEALGKEDFAAAATALSKLRAEVDAFFDDVTVNAPDPALRANRLKLLARLRRATRAVADFDRIAG